MGYYPTPPSVVQRVRSFLRFPEENVNVLDPCCGDGLALKNLVEGANATTYGIELDRYRAGQAKRILDHVLKGSYEDARISNDAFSCLFLNPPYDWASGSSTGEERNERKEKSFLRGTLNYLQPGGVLVYIVPQKSVSGDVAKVLSYRFHDFNTYRFPDEEYERFRQIVLFGRRKPEKSLNEESLERLATIPHQTLQEIPYLETPVYDLPVSPPVRLFRSCAIDEAELERDLQASPLWEKLQGYSNSKDGKLGKPPLPLHTGHLGLLLASGCLDGVVGDGEDKHVVRGKVEKFSYTEQEYQEGQVLVERDVETYRVSIKVLKRDGEILTLM
jgi:tRNA1(Val) A37 N6-methylase TrmN6